MLRDKRLGRARRLGLNKLVRICSDDRSRGALRSRAATHHPLERLWPNLDARGRLSPMSEKKYLRHAYVAIFIGIHTTLKY